jgi:hypothetical protein
LGRAANGLVLIVKSPNRDVLRLPGAVLGRSSCPVLSLVGDNILVSRGSAISGVRRADSWSYASMLSLRSSKGLDLGSKGKDNWGTHVDGLFKAWNY